MKTPSDSSTPRGSPGPVHRSTLGRHDRLKKMPCVVLCALWVMADGVCYAQSAGKIDSPTGSPCQRKELPPFTIGANVLHREKIQPDDRALSRGYGSPHARKTLIYLSEMGMHGIVLPVPFHLKNRQDSQVKMGALSGDEGSSALRRMIEDAHQRGLLVVLAPHLMLDDGEWRGEIMMKDHQTETRKRRDPAHLRRFFQSYGEAIRPLAQMAEETCVEVFSFALELKSLSSLPAAQPHFSQIIRTLRNVFHGQLTYSANWDEVHDVLFWKSLDFIAVNAFFPLSKKDNPTLDDLTKNAIEIQNALQSLREKTKRKIWILEVGYKSTQNPTREPWVWPQDVDADARPNHASQARAYRALIASLRHTSATDAVFFWAIPADSQDQDAASLYEPEYGFSFVGKTSEGILRELISTPPIR